MISKGKRAFKPKARLIQILGEHIIKDATVGLLELVKNSYDADATNVEILMSRVNTHLGRITISDNGSGMDLDTFLNQWMNPAAGHKQEQKDQQIRTTLGRLPLGEKGVGRFAAQQIGKKFRLISKMLNDTKELVVDIDWSDFEDQNKDLSEVNIDYAIRTPEIFNNKSGTVLEIKYLRNEWKKNDVARVSNALKRMKSPFRGAKDFDIKLKFINCPSEYAVFENIEITDILEKAHYKLFGMVDNDGMFEYEYDTNLPGKGIKHQPAKKVDLCSFGKVLELHKPFLCGGFFVNLNHYNKELAGKSGFAKDDIKELCGVSVYRDGIRVLPYGEKGNDWLGLDKSRIQKTDLI
jgi:hypothetical protein